MRKKVNFKSDGNTEETRVILNREHLNLLREATSTLHEIETEESESFEPELSTGSWREIKDIIPK